MKVWIDRNERWPVFSISEEPWGDEVEMSEKAYLRLRKAWHIAHKNWAAVQKELEEIYERSKIK